MPGATLTVDAGGRIVMWSGDAERMLGYSESEAVGQSIALIIPPHLRGPHDHGFRRYVKTGTSTLPDVVTTSALHRSGAIVRLQISVEAVRDADGEIVAVEATMAP